MLDKVKRVSIYQPEQPGLTFPEIPQFDSPAQERRHRQERLVAACRAFALHGLAQTHAVGFEIVDFIHEHECVIHDEAADAEDAKGTHDAHRQAVEEMPDHRTHDTKGNDEQYDERLGVAFEGDGHHPIHGSDHDQEGDQHVPTQN